ncbi:NAD(P)/FAD-dependent oxidoreductase [Frankia sp. Ag45/Mut15]|uniref:NAD(P)/FAD-dependent oxidoreductase n=1 Tax=Frankia umida TaxID=573489 RepID=A0ABT0K278_9ACTN|nr:NAD(P)/FAD-dependent oxidoreductase [Frankia umida]MCK9877895.1 NAD(P)/FAD-dependent oxidoreductase [Frankia umida]
MPSAAAQLEHLDVLIVGAGISGLGAAYYLRREHPRRSHAILEARGALGGTWDLFRYPGIRSDSDLHTFGYAFKPWRGERFLADGEQILAYLRETAHEFGIERDIRYHTKVVSASWSSPDARWTVEVVNTESGARSALTCSWLLCATGYYRYDEGFTPPFDGRERFRGQIIHPQHWPADLDVTGRRIVVIGSGATAVTLVPGWPTSRRTSPCCSGRRPTSWQPRPGTRWSSVCAGCSARSVPTPSPALSTSFASRRCGGSADGSRRPPGDSSAG